MDPSQRPTSNAPPNPYGQPQAPAYGYPYGQAPPAQAYQAPQQAYYQTPSTQADVFAALAQAPPVYAPPPPPVYVAPPAPPTTLASAKFGDETWRISGSDYLGLDLFRSLTDDKGLVISHVPAKCVAWLPASESDFFDDAGRPAALYKIRYTGGELIGDHEDLEAHEIEQSKPMSAKELKAAEDDDSVKSKASKFDPNEEVDSPDEDSDDDWGGRPAAGPPSASKKRTRNNDIPSDDGEDDDGAVAPPSEKKQLRSDPAPVAVAAAAVPPADALSNDIVAALAADEPTPAAPAAPAVPAVAVAPPAPVPSPFALPPAAPAAPVAPAAEPAAAAPPAGETAPGAV
ncbi:unnamed protein product [Pelagomonas calceolata]|uniref:Uncharacterized protein n=1 Tax=Pelagomonas calceolata TaxID=35677 RepID=A0A8J2X5S6_9STRA|nr:unnamed protein product [Pelagomonas calceolata]